MMPLLLFRYPRYVLREAYVLFVEPLYLKNPSIRGVSRVKLKDWKGHRQLHLVGTVKNTPWS